MLRFNCLFFSDLNRLFNIIDSCDLSLTDREMIILAVVCAEDRRYFSHSGVSYLSIIRAIYRRHGGASTINMQLVRVVTGRYEISISRKLREIIIATIIDIKYSKIDILRAYLGYSYYGSNINGLDGVMKAFFTNKKTKDLSLYDCCFIASLIKRPASSKLTIPWAMKINRRMDYVRDTCNSIGKNILEKMKIYL